MFKKIREYFEMKRLERQMKYALLSHLYLFVDEKDQYIRFFRTLVNEIDYHNFYSDLIEKVAEKAHETAQLERAKEKENAEVNTEE
jgi:hypothetical protein